MFYRTFGIDFFEAGILCIALTVLELVPWLGLDAFSVMKNILFLFISNYEIDGYNIYKYTSPGFLFLNMTEMFVL